MRTPREFGFRHEAPFKRRAHRRDIRRLATTARLDCFRFLALDTFGKRLLAGACAWLALGLVAARPMRAQTPHTVTGTAGFETGLEMLEEGIQPPINARNNNSTVTVNWGDGSSSPGLVQAAISGLVTTYYLYGTHIYAQPGTYSIISTYQYLDCSQGCVPNGALIYTTATIMPPGKFIILSIGDSIASGEGNPIIRNPAIPNINYPSWAFWDDAYSDWWGYTYPPDVTDAYGGTPLFPCHRSGRAGPAQAANTLIATNPASGITFIHSACSGAETEQGDTLANEDGNGNPLAVAQDAVSQLKIARERLAKFGAGIDILLISAGSNDMYGKTTFKNGFGAFVQYCLGGGHCDTNSEVQCELAQSLSGAPNLGCGGGQNVSGVPTYYKNLAMEINCQQPPPFTGASGSAQDPDPGCTDPQKQIPKLVLITEYMDPTHDQNGNFPTSNTCGPAFSGLDYPGAFEYFFHGAVEPLNDLVDDFPAYAQAAGLYVPTYAVRGIGGSDFDQGADDFLTHGVCGSSQANQQRWVNNGNDSLNLLSQGPPQFTDPLQYPPGNPIGVDTDNPGYGDSGGYPGQDDDTLPTSTVDNGNAESLNGMLHPNSGALAATLGLACSPTCGQEDYSGRIFASVAQFSPPVTTATAATAGGNAYLPGTWTNQAVTLSLSAANAISQAGVGATYYAVDNSACGSSFATQYPANVPGCTVYSSPFTVSGSGKHTVTFFSANSDGYPIFGPGTDVIGVGTISCKGAPTNAYVGIPCESPSVPPLEGVRQSVQVWIDTNPPLTASPPVQYVNRGQTATFNVTLGHAGWPAGSAVNLSCQTTAPKVSCAVIPDIVSIDASNTTMLDVYTYPDSGSAGPAAPPAPFGPTSALKLLLALATAILLAAMALAMRRGRWSRAGSFAAFAIACGLLFAGCSASQNGTPGGMYNVNLTAVSGSTSHATIVTTVVR